MQTESGSCGNVAAASGKATITLGGEMTVQSRFDLDASTCKFNGAMGSLVLSGEGKASAQTNAAVDSQSQIAAGTYAIADLQVKGKASLMTSGDVVVQGTVAIDGDSKLVVQGAFETSGALAVKANGRVSSSGKKAIKCASATFDSTSKYTASLAVAASASSVTALSSMGSVAFNGELEIAPYVKLKTGDKFIIARYASRTGTFTKVSIATTGMLRRRAAEDNWKMDYGSNEATATYSGQPQMSVAMTTASALASQPPAGTNTTTTATMTNVATSAITTNMPETSTTQNRRAPMKQPAAAPSNRIQSSQPPLPLRKLQKNQ